MAVAAPPRRLPALLQKARLPRSHGWVPYVVASILALWTFAGQFVDARVAILEPDDNGVLFSTVTYLLHGQIPITDFYEPYGIGLGIPGVIPHLLGFDSALALRVTYGVLPALMTFLVTLFLWRRVRWELAVLGGVVSVTCSVPRYAMGFAPLFAFGLMIDRLSRKTASGSLAEIAREYPRGLIAASAVLSLAGWARMEYAVFPALWAVVLFIALRGRTRWVMAGITAGFAILPTAIVVVTGGTTHLIWILRYLFSSSQASFGAQRGSPIVWALFNSRLYELTHFQFAQLGDPASVLSTYGVGAAVVVAAAAMLLFPRGRQRLLRSDPTLLLPFMLVLCAFVLYVQRSSFSAVDGELGAPIFWVAAALLVVRLPAALLALVVLILAFPLVGNFAPGVIVDNWNSRPPIGSPAVARLDIPNEAAPDFAALQGVWRQLGLDGRPTVSLELRNDVTWGGDAIVPFLLDAPAAAWPLTYDPGLVNRADVERGTVQQLCRNRAPVVQLDHDYPYPPDHRVYVGSRVLDEFLAVDYRVRAVAGQFRILTPSTPRCLLPSSLSDGELQQLRDAWIVGGQPAEAGALAVALLDRERAAHQPLDPVNASVAAMGGYKLTPDELPPAPLGAALQTFFVGPAHQSMVGAATTPYPSDIEALVAQTAWVNNHAPGQPGQQAAAQAIVALALRHPNWPQAVENAAVAEPSDGALIRTLAPGATGIAQYDQWRLNWFTGTHQRSGQIQAGLALISDYVRIDDPLAASQTEIQLTHVPGLDPGCVLLLRERASTKPGAGGGAGGGPAPSCNDPAFAQASL